MDFMDKDRKVSKNHKGSKEYKGSKKNKKNKKRKEDSSSFAYDDAFRTLISKFDDLALPFFNEIFGTHYDHDTVAIHGNNEFFFQTGGKAEIKKITDSVITVLADGMMSRYHLECESSEVDGSILIKLFEYDSMIARYGSKVDGFRLEVTFPRTALFALRGVKGDVDEMTVEIVTQGGTVSYPVALVRMSDYTLDMIFAKRVYILLPFILFNLEKEFKSIEADSGHLSELVDRAVEIHKRLEGEAAAGRLSYIAKSAIIEMAGKVADKLSVNYENIHEKVGVFMGGRIIELETLKSYEKGMAEGEAKGKAEEKAKSEKERNELKAKIESLEKEIARLNTVSML